MSPEAFAMLRKRALATRHEKYVEKHCLKVETLEEIAARLKSSNLFSRKSHIKTQKLTVVM